MSVVVLNGHPDARLTDKLSRFEEQFSYPLGDGGRFRIAHDGDVWRFFHALGEAAYAVVESDERVLGVLGAALRDVIQPDGAVMPMLYLGDLKIAAEARGGMTLIRLARAIQAHFHGRVRSAFSIVMDGTAIIPTAYTGRLGVPAFAPRHTVSILWLRTAGGGMAWQTSATRRTKTDQGLARFAELAAGQYCFPHADPMERSVLAPQWLTTDDGSACGRLEDTVRAKRLTSTTGEDMRSAHVSCFAYRQPRDGFRVLGMALDLAAQAGYPMLFVAIASGDVAAMRDMLGDRVRSVATATIFGTGLTMPGRWNINTADI